MKRTRLSNALKNSLIILGLLAGSGLYRMGYAQVSVNINIGSQPIWGPTGYDYVNYYYLPDLDIYYNVPQQQWIYFDGGRWITTTVLPARYNRYDLYSLHKVVINDNQPYLRNAVYKKQYASFRGRHDQQPIRDSRDTRYYVINNHPMHNQVANQGGNNRQNAKPNGMNGAQVGRNGGRQGQPQPNPRGNDRDRARQPEGRGPR
ncbi:hypothetical protein [Spirosoma lituiforme]